MINRWTLGVSLTGLVLVALAALFAIVVADALGDDGDGPKYEVRVNFAPTASQDDIDEVRSILRSLDPGVNFVLMESFPPIGSATVKSSNERACEKLKALGDKDYVAEVTVDCSEDTGGSKPTLSEGVLATFAVGDERFAVWVTNDATIMQLRDLEAGKSAASIPNGKLLPGAGEANHNAPWSWHLDPEDIEMAEMTVEVCDAAPSYVEENIEDFTSGAGRYCPWGAELVDLKTLAP